MKLYCLGGFFDREAVLAAMDVVSDEVLRDCRPVHTILLCKVSDAETGEVIVDETVYFRGGERGLRFPNPPDAGPSNVLNWGAIYPLRYPVDPSFPAGYQRF